MAKARGRSPGSAKGRAPARDAERRAPDRAMRLGDPVDWSLLQPLVHAMAACAHPGTDFDAFRRLVLGVTEPLRQLDELVRLAERAIGGDRPALDDFRAIVAGIAAASDDRLLDLLEEHERAAACGCGPLPAAEVTPPTIARLLNEASLSSLLVAAARLHEECGAHEREAAMGAVMGLVAAAGLVAGMADAHLRGGTAGLQAHVERLAFLGRFDWVGSAPPVRTAASTDGFAVMRGPGAPVPMPGLPMPGGGLPPVGDDDLPFPKHGIDELLGWLKKKKKWDPEIWDHPYPFWRDPLRYIDPREIDFIRCIMQVLRRLRERASIPPPPRPARIVWSDGITGISAHGACAGDTIVIRGTGLLQPGALVLVPVADGGCRPVAVAAGDWTDTTIKVTLPPGVISGPVGFGDAAFITAYDAWADEQNRLASEIEALWCYTKDIPWVSRFRQCPPDIGVNRITAGAAVIDYFTVNGETALVAETGMAVTLYWGVRNATRVEVQRTSSSGPTFGGATTLVNPIGTAYVLTPFFTLAPVIYTYRIRAEGPCGSTFRDVSIAVSKRPNLRIDAVEVTQSVQTTNHAVRLVARKPTIVRVTLRHALNGFGGNVVPNVTGRIRLRRINGGNSPWFNAANNSLPMAPTLGASITVVANPQRNNTNDTLNFLIPPGWCTQTCRFEIECRVAAYGAIGFFAGFSQAVTFTTSAAFAFENRRTMELRYIRVRWNGTTPTDQTCLDTLRGAIPLLPTPTANVFALGGVGVQTPGASTDDARNDLLDDFDDRHNCSWWEAMWEWLGADCPDDDGAIWVLIPGVFHRGRAYDIPSNVCFTPPSTATTTRGPYAAHELAHCLNQEHVSVMCANGQQATGGDAPGDWPNNAQLVDVPFDVVRNRALTLAGTGVFDVMTYCGDPDNTWPMPARWNRLWNEIG